MPAGRGGNGGQGGRGGNGARGENGTNGIALDIASVSDDTLTFSNISHPITTPCTACQNSFAFLSAIPGHNAHTCHWYDSPDNPTPINTGLSYSTQFSNSTVLYVTSYDTLTHTECPERTPLYITIYPSFTIDITDSVPVGHSYENYGFAIPWLSTTGIEEYSHTYTNSFGCDSTINLHLIVYDDNGIADHVSETCSMVVYPNPTTGTCTVKTGEFIPDGFIQIVDLCGRILHTQPAENRLMDLQTENYAPGIYFVKWVTAGSVKAVQKLIKQ